MASQYQPYQQRVIDEQSDLEEKITKLSKFIGTDYACSELDTFDLKLLSLQLSAMDKYNDILKLRISRFGEQNAG